MIGKLNSIATTSKKKRKRKKKNRKRQLINGVKKK
jgi:hypothetical protein